MVREARARGDFRQGEVALAQELLHPLDAAGDDVLVRRQPRGGLEPPGEVVEAEVGRPSQPAASEVAELTAARCSEGRSVARVGLLDLRA